MFFVSGAAGVLFACLAAWKVFLGTRPMPSDKVKENPPSTDQAALLEEEGNISLQNMTPPVAHSRLKTILQLIGLIQYHGVHGWVFFVILNWSPTLIRSSSDSIVTTGLLSACPWISAALCSLLGENHISGDFSAHINTGRHLYPYVGVTGSNPNHTSCDHDICCMTMLYCECVDI